MPDKILNDSFYVQNYDGDLTGKGGYNTQPPLLPPNERSFDEGDFPPQATSLANVYWDQEYFVFDPEADPDPTQISPREGEMRWDFGTDQARAFTDPEDTGTVVVPHDGDVRWDFDLEVLSAWDAINEVWVPLDLTTHTGGTFIVFLTQPQLVTPGAESAEIIIQRRDGDDVPITVGDQDVFLYSTDPDMTFFPSNVVTILDGDDSYAFTFTTPNSGNPVITASPEILL